MPLRRLNTIATSEMIPGLVPISKKSQRSASFTAAPSSSSTISSSSSSDSNISYTSLKEIISGSSRINSPTAVSEISIRNHLVKYAAWAYLQPMSTSPDSTTDHLYCCVAVRILRSSVFSLLHTAARAIADAFCFCFP